jgi:hypothetical protein
MELDFGITVPSRTVVDMLCQHRRATASQATKDLRGIGKLCQAFVNMNPGTVLELEVDASGTFRRFFLCPAVHAGALTCMLPIIFSDGYHGKNKEFPFQILGSVGLTNQRTQFIYAVSIVPIDDTENLTWHYNNMNRGPFCDFVQSAPRLILMGDREKGELAAGAAVMPEANLAACSRHLHKNMLRQHIVRKKGDGLWQSVAKAATFEERDALWNLLCTTAPKQAGFLAQIPKTMWQTCEMLSAGCQTHFTITNNLAETLGSRLLCADYGELPIRHRTAGPMIRGLMTMLAKQSKDLQEQAARVHKDAVRYSDYALSE